jgi:hypothetical protein
MEKLSLSRKCMSFGNSVFPVRKYLAGAVAVTVVVAGLVLTHQLKAASNCTGPTFDSGTKTLSLVCTESTDTHELACSDANNPDILSLTVNGRTETVTCPPDVLPNTLPTISISGPTSGAWGANLTYTITGTDSDVGDTLTYRVDWNNDGTADYVSGAVTSGTGVTVSNSWSAIGSQSFQAMAIDSKGGASAWVSYTITINNPPPATASLQARVNGGSWSSADQTVDPTDTVELMWSSTYASSCSGSGSGFSASAASGTDSVNTPTANSSTNFQVTCSGPGGNGSDTLRVTSRALPNLSTSIGTPQPSGFNQTTGIYSSVGIPFQVINNGGSNINVNASYEFQFDQGRDGYESTTNGNLGTLSVGQIFSRTQSLSNIPFGNHRVRVHADNTDIVNETGNADNIVVLDFSLPPIDPGLSITANPTRVQSGQNSSISWTMTSTYAMNCSVFGPGMTTRNFNPATNGTSGSVSVGPITSKSLYTLRCIEPVTNTTFTDTVEVESQGEIQET